MQFLGIFYFTSWQLQIASITLILNLEEHLLEEELKQGLDEINPKQEVSKVMMV